MYSSPPDFDEKYYQKKILSINTDDIDNGTYSDFYVSLGEMKCKYFYVQGVEIPSCIYNITDAAYRANNVIQLIEATDEKKITCTITPGFYKLTELCDELSTQLTAESKTNGNAITYVVAPYLKTYKIQITATGGNFYLDVPNSTMANCLGWYSSHTSAASDVGTYIANLSGIPTINIHSNISQIGLNTNTQETNLLARVQMNEKFGYTVYYASSGEFLYPTINGKISKIQITLRDDYNNIITDFDMNWTFSLVLYIDNTETFR